MRFKFRFQVILQAAGKRFRKWRLWFFLHHAQSYRILLVRVFVKLVVIWLLLHIFFIITTDGSKFVLKIPNY